MDSGARQLDGVDCKDAAASEVSKAMVKWKPVNLRSDQTEVSAAVRSVLNQRYLWLSTSECPARPSRSQELFQKS